MAYQPPTITAAGLYVPSYLDIIQDMVAQFITIYGQGVYLAPDSAQYQELSIYAAKASDVMRLLQLVYNNRGPNFAIGAALDSIVKMNGLARKPASSSTALLTILGDSGTVIQNGVAQDKNSYSWNLPPTVTIPVSGSIVVTGTCQTVGAITADVNTIIYISTPTAGWRGVTNAAAAIVGLPIEADSALRARQAISAMLPSHTMLQGTIAAIAATPGVTRYNVVENPTGMEDSWGNPPHSITCVVEGGTDQDVANAIYFNRGLGCYMNGTTVVDVVDVYTGVITPVRFSRPTYVDFLIALTVTPGTGFTSSTMAAAKDYILAMVNNLQIGQALSISSIVAAASQVNIDPTHPVMSITDTVTETSAPTVVAIPTIAAAGTGYALWQTLLIEQAGASRGAALEIATVDGNGGITSVVMYANGTSYVDANNVPLVAITPGSGAEVNITTAPNQVLRQDTALFMSQVARTTLANITVTNLNSLPS
jgi:uncharacterized phage protein gp47/JayE